MRLHIVPTTNAFCRSVWKALFCWLVAFATLSCDLACQAREKDQGQAIQQANDGPGESPVILLTGFEPFGQQRLPNASWEGIKNLDGQQWNEYQLVCRQMNVIWGAPMEQLRKWVAEHDPVAIFSFGQGRVGHFDFESRASNQRGGGLDNSNQRPPQPTIVDDGPSELRATIDCEQFAGILSEKGYPVRVSTHAGKYLCEEALFSLEYLKSTRPLDATVLFCHVPPLDTPLDGELVAAEHVQRFVEDTLATWYTAVQKRGTPSRAAEKVAADPRRQEVAQFITRYFRTWSNQDIKGYGACFADRASIQFISSQGRITLYALPTFLASQRESHRRVSHRQTEVAESMDIRFEQQLARVIVYWKLTAGPRIEYGYDHFTLIKQAGQWRIVNLVFYSSKRPG